MLNFFDNKSVVWVLNLLQMLQKLQKKKFKHNIKFFSSDYLEAKKFLNDTKIIYAANVICHIPDLNDLIIYR